MSLSPQSLHGPSTLHPEDRTSAREIPLASPSSWLFYEFLVPSVYLREPSPLCCRGTSGWDLWYPPIPPVLAPGSPCHLRFPQPLMPPQLPYSLSWPHSPSLLPGPSAAFPAQRPPSLPERPRQRLCPRAVAPPCPPQPHHWPSTSAPALLLTRGFSSLWSCVAAHCGIPSASPRKEAAAASQTPGGGCCFSRPGQLARATGAPYPGRSPDLGLTWCAADPRPTLGLPSGASHLRRRPVTARSSAALHITRGRPGQPPAPARPRDICAHTGTPSRLWLWAATGHSRAPQKGWGTAGAVGRKAKRRLLAEFGRWPGKSVFLERSLSPPRVPGDGKATFHRSRCDAVLSKAPQAEGHLQCLKPHPPVLLSICPQPGSAEEQLGSLWCQKMCFAHTGGKRATWQSFTSKGEREWGDTSTAMKSSPQTQQFFFHWNLWSS